MDEQRSRRQARRQFIFTYHPDHGGDPAVFAAGLADLDQDQDAGPPARVVVVPRTPLLTGWLMAAMRRFGWRRPPPRVK